MEELVEDTAQKIEDAPAAERMLGEDHPATELTLEESAKFVVGEILRLGGLKADVALTEGAADEIALAITGADAGALVGPHGHTLDSLQYLVSLMVNKDRPGRARIAIDADGYRQRRLNTLTKFAQSLADQVVATGQEAVTDPLSPHERRIIHTALADNPDIKTYSEGVEPNRYVVVSPKEGNGGGEE